MIEFIINYCAPTLAHIKVANLFSYPLTSLETLKEELRAVNEQMNPSGIYATLLKIGKKRALIYVYQQQALEIELRKLKVKQFLRSIGYQSFKLKDCLSLLKKRLMISEAFPHEIGLFLGYPVEDVVGFIRHQGKNSKHTGYWKVYGDVVESIKLFTKFKKCKHIYKQRFGSGVSIQQLIVAD